MSTEMEKVAAWGGQGGDSPTASRGRDTTKASTATAQDTTAVWLNSTFVGTVFSRRWRFDAVTTRGVALGRYNTASAAARALLEKAQE